MTAPTMTQIPGFRGDLIAPGDDRYDSARALWNGNVDRRPGLIARCRSTADIAAAVRFARAHDVEIAVRDGATTWPAPPGATTGSSSISPRCVPCRSTPSSAPLACRATPYGGT
jgi:hypothetical protein